MDMFVLPDGQWFVYGIKVSLWTGMVVGTVMGELASLRLDNQVERVWYLRAVLLAMFLLASGILAGKYLSGQIETTPMSFMGETGIDWVRLWTTGVGLGSGICTGMVFWIPILALAGNPEWMMDDRRWKGFLLFCACLAGICVTPVP